MILSWLGSWLNQNWGLQLMTPLQKRMLAVAIFYQGRLSLVPQKPRVHNSQQHPPGYLGNQQLDPGRAMQWPLHNNHKNL